VSYDLYALPVPAGTDVETAWEELMDAQEEEDSPELSDDAARAIDELAALLTPLGLERFEFDHHAISRDDGITEEEARRRYRYAELNSPDDDLPLQITLDGSGAAANIPYWHDDERARRTYALLFDAFRLVCERTGWRVYDPQLERELDLETDLDDVLGMHGEGVTQVREITEIVDSTDEDELDDVLRSRGFSVEGSRAKYPWWQFWRR
jgi:hypothetical protein